MSDVLQIDPDTVDQTASTLKDIAEEQRRACTVLMDTTADLLQPISAADFGFRQGLAAATAFWSQRVTGFAARLVDGAEFMETNAAMAREADAASEADFVALEGAMDASEYTKQQYYEATGEAPPEYSNVGDRSAMPVDEAVAL